MQIYVTYIMDIIHIIHAIKHISYVYVCVHTCMVLVSCLNKRKRAEFKGFHLLYLECMPSMVLFGKQFLYIPILRPLVPLLLKIFLV